MVCNPMETPFDHRAAFETSTILKRPRQATRSSLPHGFGTWMFAGFVGSVLLVLLVPWGGGLQVRSPQTKALAQAKQIGLALKLFAGDHDGNYPRQGTPVEMKDVPENSNQAFACLFPTYTVSESIFGNPRSAYSGRRGPDNRIDNPYTGHPVETLRPGENVYGYMMGLTDSSAPEAPIVMDGMDGSGRYTSASRARGGVWSGTKAVVVRLDNSAALETLTGSEKARYVAVRGDVTKDLLDPARWGKDVRYLDPAVVKP